jgi:hypothetical protein
MPTGDEVLRILHRQGEREREREREIETHAINK